LYNVQPQTDFDERFLQEAKNHTSLILNACEDPLYTNDKEFNRDITVQEVEHVIMKCKNGKSAGEDNIPYEVLKCKPVMQALCHFYQLCFDAGKIPEMWNKAIISPIPKSGNNDKRVPLNYRGISLLCCTSKVYSAILNHRMMKYAEENNIIVDEQNGFRSGRSCTDHIYALNSIVRNRMNENKPTFALYIDFQKAFDLVNRDLLLYRLLLYGYDGKIFNSIRAMYTFTQSCIKITNNKNTYHTEWFRTVSGVRQGDTCSTLYQNN